jgi:hypothetical protein
LARPMPAAVRLTPASAAAIRTRFIMRSLPVSGAYILS